ncbi:hypothetical protein [Bacillus sp. EB01]|uniref:hypothetical protein n=1 Tax=Bacillus sp. EB01 TaxID=1347086 RepID=UPI0012DE8FCF|nr:hypothetical protein [Bacillus sp. EB01]
MEGKRALGTYLHKLSGNKDILKNGIRTQHHPSQYLRSNQQCQKTKGDYDRQERL